MKKGLILIILTAIVLPCMAAEKPQSSRAWD